MTCPRLCARRGWPVPSGVEPTRHALSTSTSLPLDGGGAFGCRDFHSHRGNLFHVEIVPGNARRTRPGRLRGPARDALAGVVRAAIDGHRKAAEFLTHLSAHLAGHHLSAGTAPD